MSLLVNGFACENPTSPKLNFVPSARHVDVPILTDGTSLRDLNERNLSSTSEFRFKLIFGSQTSADFMNFIPRDIAARRSSEGISDSPFGFAMVRTNRLDRPFYLLRREFADAVRTCDHSSPANKLWAK